MRGLLYSQSFYFAQNTNPVPWLDILTSPPVWALIITYLCNSWGTYMLVTTLPLYMNAVLHFDILAVRRECIISFIFYFFLITHPLWLGLETNQIEF